MRFSTLPERAKRLIIAVWLAALVSVLFVLAYPPAGYMAPGWEIGLLCLIGGLMGGKKIRLVPNTKDPETGSMSLGFAVTFIGLLMGGPLAGMIVSLVTSLGSGLLPRRQPWVQLGFNACLGVVEAACGGLVLTYLLATPVEPPVLRLMCAVAGATAVVFFINTGAVADIVARVSNRRGFEVWKEDFVWTAPSFFAGSAASTLAFVLMGENLGTILMFTAPVVYFTFATYALYNKRAQENQQHVQEIQENQAKLADLYLATIRSLALAIDAKDEYTSQHIVRVQHFAVAIAQQMQLPASDFEAVRTGALLHDIGKLGIPDTVLLKPGRLTDEEFAVIKRHPDIGAQILGPVQFPWPVLEVVRHHHERWDGSGYPCGLSGREIPITARILSVADVYDALTSDRSYRKAWSHEAAMEHIRKSAGKDFDPVVVEAFSAVVDQARTALGEKIEAPSLQALPGSLADKPREQSGISKAG